MTRRFITSLLTIAYFIGQLAAPPHAHGDSRVNEPSDHDARPHFHLSLMTHGGHSHDHELDHHHDAGDQFRHHDCAEHADHDSDAIYLPNGPELSLPTKSVTAPFCLNLVSNLAIECLVAPAESFHASTEATFPDKCSPRCALYLTLRALRI